MQVSIYLDDDTNGRLSDAAKDRGESRNMLMLRAVREWLNRQDKDEAPEDHAALTRRPPPPTWQDSAIMV